MPAMTMIDRWSVRAPIETVFEVLSDLRTYTAWGKPTYVSCDVQGEPAVGRSAELCIRGALPMAIRFRVEILRLEAPNTIEIAARGDLDGRWLLTFNRNGPETAVDSTWTIEPQKPVARMLAPLLEPLFQWNHHKAMTRTFPGLQSFIDARLSRVSSVSVPRS
jgi:hypothetical protein